MTTEVVLPDGRFARMRPVLMRDVVFVHAHFPPELMTPALVALTVELDGAELALGALMEMEYAVALPMIGVVNRQLAAALRTCSGVA